MMELNVESEVKKLQVKMGADIKQVDKAVNVTINRMAVTIRKEGVKELAKVTGLKQKKLREGITLTRSRVKTLKATIRARGRPFNLASFGAKVWKVKKKVVGVKAKPWGKRHSFKGVFILPVAGNPVLKRQGQRLKSVYGPGIATESQRTTILKLYNAIGRKRFLEEFPRNLKHQTDKVRMK